jgi:muramoyltetrapeptide carboxypeptidase
MADSTTQPLNHPSPARPLLRPEPLRPGDTIGVVSTSAAFAGRELMWLQMQQYLTGKGYRVKVGPHAQSMTGYLAGTDAQRLADFHALWEDPSVKAIFCSQGGYGSMRLLDKLDYDLLAAHPKILMGYSDVSGLLMAVHSRTGLVVFHGPMAVSDFGKMPANAFTEQHCWAMLTGAESGDAASPLPLANAYTPYYQSLRPGVVEGPLYAMNLQLLTALIGTSYLPDLTGAVLLIEDVGGYIYLLDRMLTQFRLSGILERLGGLVFGEFVFMQTVNPIIPINIVGAPTLPQLLAEFAEPLRYPVGFGFSMGHTDVKVTVPCGVRCRFDAATGQIALLEPHVALTHAEHSPAGRD